MKDANQYQTDQAIAILLMGEPGAGKTNLCMEWPDPYFIDADGNLKNAIERHPGKRFWWDSVEVDDDGKPVEPKDRWPRLSKLMENAARPEVKTFVIDSLSKVSEYLQDYVIDKGSQAERPLVVGGERVMSQSLWNPFKQLLVKMVIKARAYGKPFILTSHIKTDKDEVTGVLGYRPALSGQMADTLAYLFTDAYLCDTEVKDGKVRYFIRTMPSMRFKQIKCSCGLPAELSFTWDAFCKVQAGRGASTLDKSVASS